MEKTDLTLHDAHEFLISHAFRLSSSPKLQRIYHHAATGTLILLPNRPDDAPFSDQDIASLRHHLVGRKIMSAETFSAFADESGDAPESLNNAA